MLVVYTYFKYFTSKSRFIKKPDENGENIEKWKDYTRGHLHGTRHD